MMGNEFTRAKMTITFFGRGGYNLPVNALKEPEVRRINARCAFANGEHITK